MKEYNIYWEDNINIKKNLDNYKIIFESKNNNLEVISSFAYNSKFINNKIISYNSTYTDFFFAYINYIWFINTNYNIALKININNKQYICFIENIKLCNNKLIFYVSIKNINIINDNISNNLPIGKFLLVKANIFICNKFFHLDKIKKSKY